MKKCSQLKKVTMTPEEIEAVYGIPRSYLANLRWRKEGAKYFSVNRRIYYRISDFEAWFFSHPTMTRDAMELQQPQEQR